MTFYEVLGVAPDATAAELRAAYRRLVREVHPDRDGGTDDAMVAVNDAWYVLSDPHRRASYDARLARPTAPPTRPLPTPTPAAFDVDDEDDPALAYSDEPGPWAQPHLTRRLGAMIVVTACVAVLGLLALYVYAFLASG